MNEATKTGYPSIDKPWLKYYSEAAPRFEARKSMYAFLKEHAPCDSSAAYVYFGNKISFVSLFRMIDEAARSALALGLQEGDTVTFVTSSTPESIACIYAMNRLGINVNMEFPTEATDILKDNLERTNSKVLFVLDSVAHVHEGLLAAFGGSTVLLPVAESMKASYRLVAKLTGKFPHSSALGISYATFLNKGRTWRGDLERVGSRDGGFYYTNTSGSTGKPKKVVLSSYAINSIIGSYLATSFSFSKGDTYLSPAPPFLAYGITLTIHLPLCAGVTTYLAPIPKPDETARMFLKVHPNHFLGAPAYITAILRRKSLKAQSFAYLKTLAVGGESFNDSQRAWVEGELSKRGASVGLTHGYGLTELSSTATTEMPNAYRMGSVGIPLLGVVIKAMHRDLSGECKYGEVGEIWISSPGIMNGYYGTFSASDDAITIDENGAWWIRTGDLGYIDEDGFLFLKGRIKRIFLTQDPITGTFEKFFPDRIEEEILKVDGVKSCAVIGLLDESNTAHPVAFLVPEIDADDIEQCVANYLRDVLPPHSQPTQYEVIDELPLLASGKANYCELERRAAE